MSALEDISSLIDTMRSRKGEMTSFEGLLSEISVALADVVSCLDRPLPDQMLLINALLEGFRSLRITAPDVHVTFNAPEIQAPVNNITVPPSNVVFMPSDDKPNKGWNLFVMERDGNGAIRKMSLKPE